MKKKKFYISIEIGIATAFIILVLVTSISLSIFISSSVRRTMREDLEKQLYNVVSIGSLLVDGDDLDLVVDKNQFNSPTYKNIKKELQQIRDSSLGVHHVYTMRLNSKNQVLFIVDADEDYEEISMLGVEFTTPTELMMEIFADPNGTNIETSFDTDQWGTWLSGYAPIYNSSGELSGIVGVDMSAKEIVEYERRMLLIILLASLIISIIVCLMGLQVSKRITKPLKLIEDDLAKIRNFELSPTPNLPTVFKEVRNFHLSVENLKNGLRSFEKYVPSALVRQLIDLEKEATLSMERRELTVFFSDIADFTTISEKMPLDRLSTAMTSYLTNLTTVIHQKQGTIDKYIGDSIMAFWGAPLEIKNHPLLACEAALECQQFLQQFNKDQEQGFITRIGVHTGEVMVGNMGAKDRLNYTVIGDSVNVASRLEGLNKKYGTSILISEDTYTAVKEEMLARIVDKVVVKGKTTGTIVYELIDKLEKSSKETIEFVENFNHGMTYYFNQQWSLALEKFQKCMSLDDTDKLLITIAQRCQNYAEVAPGEE